MDQLKQMAIFADPGYENRQCKMRAEHYWEQIYFSLYPLMTKPRHQLRKSLVNNIDTD